MRTLAITVALTLLVAFSAQADVLQLTEGVAGYTGAEDNAMWNEAPDNTMGLNDTWYIRNGVVTTHPTLLNQINGLIRFDVSGVQAAIGAGSTIDSVQLLLSVFYSDPGSGDLQLYAIDAANGSWTEGNIVYGEGGVGDTTWNNQLRDLAHWQTYPNFGLADVSNLTHLDTVAVASNIGVDTPLLFDVPVAVMQGWASGGNPGLLLKRDLETTVDLANDARIRTSQYAGTPSLRPTLIVNYTPIPEPTTISLFGLLAMLIRKK